MMTIVFPDASNGTKWQTNAHLMPMPIDLTTTLNSVSPNVHFMRIGWRFNIGGITVNGCGHAISVTDDPKCKGWWARQDSNLQQHGYEPWVLTN
jgi:hypothetical protein